jgi:hypothetical protein
MDAGWKADLEGGPVPLVGLGELAGELDQERLAQRFESSCRPTHHALATIGCKSLTLTVPKEVSLYAEGHREEARAALHGAAKTAVGRLLRGLSYAGVTGIHTRNQLGEIHYHAHVLVGKFARHVATGCTVTLNNSIGLRAIREMGLAWHEGVAREFRERLRLGIEDKLPWAGPVALILPDGSRLDPLDRETQRQSERRLCPTFTETTKTGATVVRRFHLRTMDDRIFEIASGARGTAGWSSIAFTDSFPDLAGGLSRYEARVKSLQSIGYLSPEGQITPSFRVHFASRHEASFSALESVRQDLQRRLDGDGAGDATALPPARLWLHAQDYADLRRRIERLGYSAEEVRESFARALAQKPSRETLQPIRATWAKREEPEVAPAGCSPAAILRAYADRREIKIQRIYLVAPGMARGWQLEARRAFGDQLKRVAEHDLSLARNHRLAQPGLALRPVIWLARLPMPWDSHRLDLAITRCGQLARQQQIHRSGRVEIQRAYELWRAKLVTRADAKKAQPALPAGRHDDRLADPHDDRLAGRHADRAEPQIDEPPMGGTGFL